MTLLHAAIILAVILIVGVALYAIGQIPVVDATAKKIARFVLITLLVIWLLYEFGLLAHILNIVVH